MGNPQGGGGRGGGGDEHAFLGEPQWEPLPDGRVRCVQTGHEMPLAAQSTYASTKKCRSALFDAALAKGELPLNFFHQSPDAKDKVICNLTGVVLNKKENVIWRHMLGKKFEQKLAEREAEKKGVDKDIQMRENSAERPSSTVAEREVIYGREGMEMKEEVTVSCSLEDEVIHEGANSDCDFWVPPVGSRWDFDIGGDDRWSVPHQIDPNCSTVGVLNRSIEATPSKNDSEVENGVTDMIDGDGVEGSSGSSDGDEGMISAEQTLTLSYPKSNASKRKAKRQKTAAGQENGKSSKAGSTNLLS